MHQNCDNWIHQPFQQMSTDYLRFLNRRSFCALLTAYSGLACQRLHPRISVVFGFVLVVFWFYLTVHFVVFVYLCGSLAAYCGPPAKTRHRSIDALGEGFSHFAFWTKCRTAFVHFLSASHYAFFEAGTKIMENIDYEKQHNCIIFKGSMSVEIVVDLERWKRGHMFQRVLPHQGGSLEPPVLPRLWGFVG